MRRLLNLFLFLSVCNVGKAQDPIIGAYYDKTASILFPYSKGTLFSINNIPQDLLTDLYFSYVYFNAGSILHPTIELLLPDRDKAIFHHMRELKRKSKSLTLFMAIGGESFNDPKTVNGSSSYKYFSKMSASKFLRTRFILNTIHAAYENGFDGISIDWEYPADLTTGGMEEDLDNFLALLKEFHSHLSDGQPRLLLSASFPPFIPQGLPSNIQNSPTIFYKWIANCSQYLDRVLMMAFSYHDPYENTKATGVNAPLNRDTTANSTRYIAKSIENYLVNGVPKEKLILGIPLFGHSYRGVSDLTEENFTPGKPFVGGGLFGIPSRTPGMLAYNEITRLIDLKTFSSAIDPTTNTAIAYSVKSKEWISYDTPDTIKLKAEMAAKNGLRGIVFWSIDQDEYETSPPFPSITAGKLEFLKNLGIQSGSL